MTPIFGFITGITLVAVIIIGITFSIFHDFIMRESD